MFEDQGKDAVFIEYSSSGKTQRHMSLECIPVPNELGEMGPIFFKVSKRSPFGIYSVVLLTYFNIVNYHPNYLIKKSWE